MMARPKPCSPVFCTGRMVGMRGASPLQHGPGGVGAAVVHHDDLVLHAVQPQFQVEVLDGGGDGAFFVAAGDHDGEKPQRFVAGGRRSTLHMPLRSSQSGIGLGMARDLFQQSRPWAISGCHPKWRSQSALSITTQGMS